MSGPFTPVYCCLLHNNDGFLINGDCSVDFRMNGARNAYVFRWQGNKLSVNRENSILHILELDACLIEINGAEVELRFSDGTIKNFKDFWGHFSFLFYSKGICDNPKEKYKAIAYASGKVKKVPKLRKGCPAKIAKKVKAFYKQRRIRFKKGLELLKGSYYER